MSGSVTDQGPTVGLDLEAVRSWLSARTGLDGRIRARRISGGRSNLTYAVDLGEESLVLRRPPLGGVLRGAHDVAREYRIVVALQGSGVPVPEAIALCEDPQVTGAPISVVRRVDGLTLRSPADLRPLSAAARAALVENFAAALAALHALPPETSRMAPDRGAGYVPRQLHVWRRQLEAEPQRALPAMGELAGRLASSVPEQSRTAIIHGDYRLDNVLVTPDGAVLGVIDWELWTLGDPMADLGAAVAYWTDSRYELAPLGLAPTQDGALGGREQFVAAYEAAAGTVVDRDLLRWHVAFGLWRFAAILEGVYRRNLSGAYGDARSDDWQRFGHVVPALAEVGLAQLDAS